ncbi:MAG: S8 family serine peptidase [Actinomycetota bacterium]|nr:S8 family serine peptidase [Actinomycetota bacterium]
MARKTAPDQYVLLPARGLRAKKQTSTPAVQSFLQAAPDPGPSAQALDVGDGRRVRVRIVDSIGPGGAKLIEASPEDVLAIRSTQPGLRVVPVVYYTPAWAPRKEVTNRVRTFAQVPKSTIRVVSRKDGKPIRGAILVAFTDYASGTGAQAVTNAKGEAALNLGGATELDRLYVYPVNAFWTLRRRRLDLGETGAQVSLRPLDLAVPDGVRHYYGEAGDSVGEGVVVGIVDTGCGPHPDLVIAGGANTVEGEKLDDHGDNGLGHGTHVAGIVAARGTPPTGARGVAPGVALRSYRVFARNTGQASNFAIAKAIDTAVADGCHLINLSLGATFADPAITAAVDEARDVGTLCIAATGNDGRQPVRYPAANELTVAVSALGRKGTFPTDSAEAEEVAPPAGTDSAEFIAAFSNIGPQVDATAPGVGIISTYLADSYAEISGTSMAAPAVTGVAARLLSGSEVLAMKKDAGRHEAMMKTVLSAAVSRGFGARLEGHGLPQAPAGI